MQEFAAGTELRVELTWPVSQVSVWTLRHRELVRSLLFILRAATRRLDAIMARPSLVCYPSSTAGAMPLLQTTHMYQTDILLCSLPDLDRQRALLRRVYSTGDRVHLSFALACLWRT